MSETGNQFVISIMSRDRVGIVYEISKAISELDGNIADIRQSVLCGYFTMILLASFPDAVNQRAIERKLAEVDANSETLIEQIADWIATNILGMATDDAEISDVAALSRIARIV